MKRTLGRAKVVLAGVIAIAFIALIQLWIGWPVLLQPWDAIAPTSIAGGFALVLATHGLRAMRLHDYFGGPVHGRRLACLRLVLRHNLFNNLLPMRSGELAFPVLMARSFGVRPAASIPGLLWFRALDVHAVLLLTAPALAVFVSPQWAVPLTLAWLALPWLGYRWGRALADRVGEPRGRWGRGLALLLHALPEREPVFWRTQVWTLANWGLKLLLFAEILRWFVPLDLALALLGAAGGELTSVLPVHGLAGLGSYEAGVVAGLSASGLAPAGMMQAAVNLHLFVLGVTVTAGGLALLPERSRAGLA